MLMVLQWLFVLAGLVAFLRTRKMREQINRMSVEIVELRTQMHRSLEASDQSTEAKNSTESISSKSIVENTNQTPIPLSDPVQDRENKYVAAAAGVESHALMTFLRRFKDQWMVWIGGLSIGLAGVFLVRYSIDQGWLGPHLRIMMGISAGIGLHAVAEFLRRKWGQHDALAALAGGASIMLYAALLASLIFYELFSARFVFAALAVTSIGTMLLSTVHGPVLAAIGLLGAYVVPVLVPLESSTAHGLLLYGFIISAAGLALTRYVYRHWLWFGVLAGMVFTWALSFVSFWTDAGERSLYLMAIGWALVAIRDHDFSLLRGQSSADMGMTAGPWRSFLSMPGTADARNLFVLVGLQILNAINTIVFSAGEYWLWSFSLMPLAVFLICWKRPQFAALPWLSLLAMTGGLLIRYVNVDVWNGDWPVVRWESVSPDVSTLLSKLLIWMAVLYSGLAAWRLFRSLESNKGVWASLCFLAPIWFVVVAALILPATISDQLWKPAFVLGLVYMAIAIQFGSRAWSLVVVASLLLASHAAYSVAVVIVFEQATVTLALAAQVVSLAWLTRKFPGIRLGWAMKMLLILIVVRLSLNPFLLRYPVDTNWSIWSIGGSLVFVLLAMKIAVPVGRIKIWLMGSAMHLGLLLASSQIRFWLHDGDVFSRQFSLTEASLHTMVWGTMAMVYLWRADKSEQMAWLYRLMSIILIVMASAMYVAGQLIVMNPIFNYQPEISPPVFNILLIGYGIPVLLFIYAYRFTQLRSLYLGWAVAFSAFVFSIMEIRHVWQAQMHLSEAIKIGEQYTYSAVWLIMAVTAMLLAIRVNSTQWYRGGAAMLLLVTIKIFLVDMNGLTGMLRVLSFLGLGLGLLTVAWLHQKMSPALSESAQSTAG